MFQTNISTTNLNELHYEPSASPYLEKYHREGDNCYFICTHMC